MYMLLFLNVHRCATVYQASVSASEYITQYLGISTYVNCHCVCRSYNITLITTAIHITRLSCSVSISTNEAVLDIEGNIAIYRT